MSALNASLNYGGDAAGLICGYLLGEDAAPREVDSVQAAQWLALAGPNGAAAPAGEFLWLHFNLSQAQAMRWMERHADLPEAFFDALKDRSVSTRIERDDDTLIAVLNDAQFDFAFEPSDIATLWTSVARHLMVTGRTRPLRSVDALRTAVRSGSAPRSSVGLLAELMRTQASGLVDIVRGVTQRIDDVEDEL
ncbi:MAG: magnesium transporter CorA, partial [Comamonadaceae bacterium]